MAAKKFSRLKVFQAQIGFFETVVATPSRPKALEAWGTHQDLFAQGQAVELDRSDPAAQAALEQAGEVLTRPVGSKTAFKPGAEGAPEPPSSTKGKAKAKTTRPDRSRLDAAEAALKQVDDDEASALAGFKAERLALEERVAAAELELAERRKAAEAALKGAKKAYKAS